MSWSKNTWSGKTAGVGKPIRASWFDDEPRPLPPVEQDMYEIHGLKIPVSNLAWPEGEVWPTDPTYQRRLRILLEEYAMICAYAKVIFPIVAGYRKISIRNPREQLKNVHERGLAIDLAPVEGWTIAQMGEIAWMVRWLPGSRIMGVGVGRSWLHIDIKPRRLRRLWPKRPCEYLHCRAK